MHEIKIEQVPVDQLKPAEYNPRIIDPATLARLKKGIAEFGLVDPLVINHDNTVIGGHQRLTAVFEMGGTTEPYVRVNVDQQKEKALNLALNKISGDWEFNKLNALLGELGEYEELDIELTGFDLLEATELTELGGDFGDFSSVLDPGDDADGIGGDGGKGDGASKNYSIQYTLVFNNEAEQEAWAQYLKDLKKKYPDLETISARISADIS